MISVVTPTYNRAHLLPRLANSIHAQRETITEWIVVDDGSTDGTEAVIQRLRSSIEIPIIYEYQANAGRMVALNRGLELVTGRLVAFMDSDDWFAGNSLSIIAEEWNAIDVTAREHCAGIVALCADEDGNPLGKNIPAEPFDTDLVALSERHRLRGDRKEFIRIDVLRRFAYETVQGERRVATSTIWPAISEAYFVRFLPAVVVFKTYQPSGMTANIDLLRAKSPTSSAIRYWNYLTYKGRLPLRSVVKNAANFVRYSLHGARFPRNQNLTFARRVSLVAAAPIGAWLYTRDRIRLARSDSQ
jgi:glycosyltransferase involved in cell wall biosynthesis